MRLITQSSIFLFENQFTNDTPRKLIHLRWHLSPTVLRQYEHHTALPHARRRSQVWARGRDLPEWAGASLLAHCLIRRSARATPAPPTSLALLRFQVGGAGLLRQLLPPVGAREDGRHYTRTFKFWITGSIKVLYCCTKTVVVTLVTKDDTAWFNFPRKFQCQCGGQEGYTRHSGRRPGARGA